MDPRVFKNQVSSLFVELWPRVAKNLTDPQKEEWAHACGNHAPETVCQALRAMYRESDKYPTCASLRAKLSALTGGESRRCSHTETREREEHERHQHEIRQAVDKLTDEQLAGHALMHAASDPYLYWTLGLDPRRDKGMRAVIFMRLEAGLDHETTTVVRTGQQGRNYVDLTTEQIDAAQRAKKKIGARGQVFTGALNVSQRSGV